ncbi:hypothetical protein [Achromobacter sp. UMC46]|uniref:hypothetical protein n=1 Tax=Achromobacter sp. UMC46 TaxID=1862319 RepID=UPI001603CB6D|nr:hypothetical protein [Achromobacter sp. UMC46]MBB1593892.1 hypothetical protein [Achromobacter sp. UMC46]
MISQDKPLQSPRARPGWLRVALVAGVAVLVSAVVIGVRNAGEREQEQVASTEIRKVADTLSQMVGNPEVRPEALPAIDPTPKATGFYGELERVIKTVAGERLAQHKAYLQDLNDIGMPRLLDAHRLARDTGLVESRMILEQAEHLLPKYQQQSLQVLKDMPALIRSLAIREPEKQKMLTRLNASFAQRNASLEQVWTLEARILQEFGQMITLLDDNRQYWYADHDELLFDHDDDLNRFRQHMAAIGKLSAEQEQLGKQQLTNLLSALP